MGKCGCDGATCACRVIAGTNVRVTGSGSALNPLVISADVGLTTRDSSTVGLTLLGEGNTSNPWILEADLTAGLDDLTDVSTAGAVDGQVLAKQLDGSYAFVPPVTAAAGSVATGDGLEGDGSGGDPLNIRLASQSGLEVVGTGLRLDPYIVASEAALAGTYGTVQNGTFIALADGSAMWVKSTSGFAEVVSDSGTITTASGNITAAAGWVIDAVSLRRRNGIVMVYITAHSTSSYGPASAGGDITSFQIATIVDSQFRPVIPAPLRTLSSGSDHAAYIATSGQVFISALSEGAVTYSANVQQSFCGTFIGV